MTKSIKLSDSQKEVIKHMRIGISLIRNDITGGVYLMGYETTTIRRNIFDALTNRGLIRQGQLVRTDVFYELTELGKTILLD